MVALGIIGGLGPLAGAHFYKRLVELTPARKDEDHLSVILMSSSDIPSRIAHLSGEGISPVPKMQHVARQLQLVGANVLVIPSSTTHLYYSEIAASVEIPVLNLIDEVANHLAYKGIVRIAVLATTPTRKYQVYDQVLEKAGISLVYPDEDSQEELMQIISSVKSGQNDEKDRKKYTHHIIKLCSRPWAHDVEAMLLACTELPAVFSNKELTASSYAVLDATDILANASIRAVHRLNAM